MSWLRSRSRFTSLKLPSRRLCLKQGLLTLLDKWAHQQPTLSCRQNWRQVSYATMPGDSSTIKKTNRTTTNNKRWNWHQQRNNLLILYRGSSMRKMINSKEKTKLLIVWKGNLLKVKSKISGKYRCWTKKSGN